MATMERICAWCQKHLGTVEIDGEDIISHGMCKRCELTKLEEMGENLTNRIKSLKNDGKKLAALRFEKMLSENQQKISELINEAGDSLAPVALMRLTETKDPDELLKKHNRDDIVIEEKLDGWKMQAIKSGGKVRIYSRRGEEKTDNFPELVDALKGLPDSTLVEGELVYWDKGKQDVTKVTSLAGSSADKSHEKAKELPGKIKIHFYDILWNKGKKVADEPFNKRRKLLESAVKTSEKIELTKQYPFSKWEDAMNAAVKSGGEGIVLKLKDKPYEYKPKGSAEPKPADIMFKYKGGAGKSDSDDYVIYDSETTDKGNLKAQFGQYYKGKLYHISEISNFSKEDEGKIKNKLSKGSFVIEIGFQERVPGGLRHQKFLRFREDKNPKDATMHEFHAKHIDEFEIAKKAFALSIRASFPLEVEKELTKELGGKTPPTWTPKIPEWAKDPEEKDIKPEQTNILRNMPDINVDVESLFKIVSHLESGGKVWAVGDAGTSFGPTQVHGPYFVMALARDPEVAKTIGISSAKLRNMSRSWKSAIRMMRRAYKDVWIEVPVDQTAVQEFVGKNPNRVLKRLEGTTIRYSDDMIVKKRGGRYVGLKLNEPLLNKLGLNTSDPRIRAGMKRIVRRYVTKGVARNSLAQLFLTQSDPQAYAQFRRIFNRRNIRRNKDVGNLINRVSQRDFMNKVNAVAKYVKQSGYDVNAPGAYNFYQLVFIANASGAGRVAQFLLRKKPFHAGNLHYIQSSRFMRAIRWFARDPKGDPGMKQIASQLLAGIPSQQGMGGFETRVASLNDDRERRITQPLGPPEMMRKFWWLVERVHSVFSKHEDLYYKAKKEYEQQLGRGVERKEFFKLVDDAIWKWLVEKKEKKVASFSKQAAYAQKGTLYFPGQYADDISTGKRRMTIRAADVPVRPNEVVKAMTYSGSPICDLRILSKNRMSITRILKAFGKRVARALEQKFGPERRFMVVRFEPFAMNEADDDSKWSEVLIEKEGVKLTRQQIKDHYSKPAIKQKIMDVIKDKPVLIYIGVGKNNNVLKRNHSGKPIVIKSADPDDKENPSNYFYWVERRMTGIHQVFGTKTDIGFVDLDIHGSFPLSKAKKYAREVSKKIKSEFGVKPTTYQSGGSGLHVEFKLGEEKSINQLRTQLKGMLDEINEDWGDVTTGVVKGDGMRSDISTLHNKGSIRVPGSIGETYGKIKKPVGESDANDWADSSYADPNYGKRNVFPNRPVEESGAISAMPPKSQVPTDGVGSYFALSKRDLKKEAFGLPERNYIWIWEPREERFESRQTVSNGKDIKPYWSHSDLAENNGIDILDPGLIRGMVSFFKGEDEGEVHIYQDIQEIPSKLMKKLQELAHTPAPKIEEIDLPAGSSSAIWESEEKRRQYEKHMEKRKWMGYNEPDPEFMRMLDIKFASKRKKKILMLIAPEEFYEPEYFVPRRVFAEKFGFEVDVTSDKQHAFGSQGTEVITTPVSKVDAADYDSFFVVGGKGMIEFSKDKGAQKLLKRFVRQKKPIAMICHGPLLAAEAGVIRGREITGWPEIIGKIRRAKGSWTGMPIERDGFLFTAIGPDDAENLAFVMANFLNGRETLGSAPQKMLDWKTAHKKLQKIWKIGAELTEEEEELARLIQEQEKEEGGEEQVETIEDELAHALGLPTQEEKSDVGFEEAPKPYEGDYGEFVEPTKLKVQPKPVEVPKEEVPTEEKKPTPLEKRRKLQEELAEMFGGDEDEKEEPPEDVPTPVPEPKPSSCDNILDLPDEEIGKCIILDIEEENENVEEQIEEAKEKTQRERDLEDLFGPETDEELTEEDFIAHAEQKSRERAKTIFGVKLEPPVNKEGNILSTWPDLAEIKMPPMSSEAAVLFSRNMLGNSRKISEIFNDPGMDAWRILHDEPHILQSWILPALITSVGKKWFDVQKIRAAGGKFRGVGNTPFSMFDESDAEIIKNNPDIRIEDLTKAKRYIQEINKLVPQFANVYFSKGYSGEPIGSWLKVALGREMKKLIASDNDFKEKKYPLCTVCKKESPKSAVLPRMVEVPVGKKTLWKCPSCAQKVHDLDTNEIATVDNEMKVAKRKVENLEGSLPQRKVDIEDADTPEKKAKAEKKLQETQQNIIEAQKAVSELSIKREQFVREKMKYEAQLRVPRYHTVCPNVDCPGQKVPMTAIDWNHSIWNDEARAKDLLEKLYRRFKLAPPSWKKFGFDVEEESNEAEDSKFDPPEWLKTIPFKCPHDGIEFTLQEALKQAREKGDERAGVGFLCEPYFKMEWKSKLEQKGKEGEVERQEGENPDVEEMMAYQQLGDIAKDIFLKRYWDQYKKLEEIKEKYGDKWEKVKTKPRIAGLIQSMVLYDTVRQFSSQNPKAYVGWLAGREFVRRFSEEGDTLTKWPQIRNSTTTKREDIYLPILQSWIDNMLYGEGENWEDRFYSFGLSHWLTNMKTDDIPSDGPGTFFISQIKEEVGDPESEDDDANPYGFQFNFTPAKQRGGERASAKHARLLRIVGMWSLSGEEVKGLRAAIGKLKGAENRVGKRESVPAVIAKKIIQNRQNIKNDISGHDYNRVALDRDVTDLLPEDYVLVQALVMPGQFNWAPINAITRMRDDVDNEKIFAMFGELAIKNNDDREFWQGFSKVVETIKERLGDDKDLTKAKIQEFISGLSKKASFHLSKRAKDPLSRYKKKRNFDETPEPEGKVEGENKHRFVIQKHDADKAKLHYDLRLENDEGTMSSWSIPKHKMPTGSEKLLAVPTEDHPTSYNKFEGKIPEGYGAGKVTIHDSGTYKEIERQSDKIIFKLNGKKEKGTYVLVKTKKNWLFMKHKSE